MSDSNRVELNIIEETEAGVIPTNPTFQQLRFTGAPDLAQTTSTETTNEIRPDREVTDLILVGISAGGSSNHELSYGALDTILEGALFNSWVVKAEISSTEVTSGSYQAVDTTGVVVGSILQVTGFATTDNNGLKVVTAVTGTTITVSGLSDESGATATLKVVGQQAASDDLTITVDTNGTGEFTSTALDFTSLGLVSGEWIYVGGSTAATRFDTASLNGWYRVNTVAANSIMFDRTPTVSSQTSDNGSGKTIEFYVGDRLTNGTALKSYTLERRFTDHNPVTNEYFKGMSVNSLSIDLQARSIVTVNANYTGFVAGFQDRPNGTTVNPAPTNTPLNTSSNVGRLGMGSAAVTGPNFVLGASIEINNNLRETPAIQTTGSVETGVGEFNVSGSVNTLFNDPTIAQQITDNTETNFSMAFVDTRNHGIVFDLPSLKFTEGTPEVSGKNTDVVLNPNFQALRDANLGYTMLIQRFDYIPG